MGMHRRQAHISAAHTHATTQPHLKARPHGRLQALRAAGAAAGPTRATGGGSRPLARLHKLLADVVGPDLCVQGRMRG